MDELENGKIDGHAWYRDDSDYIQNIERSRDFMKGRIEQLEQLCRSFWRCSRKCKTHALYPCLDYDFITYRMDELGLLEGNR